MDEFISKLIPKTIKEKILSKFLRWQMKNRQLAEKAIPKYQLKQEHINNLKVLLNRESLLNVLPKNGIVAEIGVDHGAFSEKILTINKPSKFYLIDAWDSERFSPGYSHISRLFSNRIANNEVEVIRSLSFDAVNLFDDGSLDWIYIDSDHGYEVTIKELTLFHPKIKPGGIIAGHDFVVGNWVSGYRYGVIEAVFEFCVKEKWEMVYVTMEQTGFPSFAIRKLNS